MNGPNHDTTGYACGGNSHAPGSPGPVTAADCASGLVTVLEPLESRLFLDGSDGSISLDDRLLKIYGARHQSNTIIVSLNHADDVVTAYLNGRVRYFWLHQVHNVQIFAANKPITWPSTSATTALPGR